MCSICSQKTKKQKKNSRLIQGGEYSELEIGKEFMKTERNTTKQYRSNLQVWIKSKQVI